MHPQTDRVPIIRLWNLVLAPIQGDLDDLEAERLRHAILTTLHGSNVQGLVIDVTGLWLMDSHLCATLTRIARAAALMGTPTVLCGISAEIALTIQTMGVALDGIDTTLSLEQALELFGVAAPSEDSDDDDHMVVTFDDSDDGDGGQDTHTDQWSKGEALHEG